MKKAIFKTYLKLFWMNHKRKVAAGAGLVILLAGGIYLLLPHKEYFYIDYEGNRGVAKICRATSAGLYCNREYGGNIMVQEYWQED